MLLTLEPAAVDGEIAYDEDILVVFHLGAHRRRTATFIGPSRNQGRVVEVMFSRYDIFIVEIYQSAYKHGVSERDIEHAIGHAIVAAEQSDAKVLYLGADMAGNILEVISVMRDDGTEVVIHAMQMRPMYESLVRDLGDNQ